jgi:hypothetical protein
MKPSPFTNSDLIVDYWMKELLEEQKKTNELLSQLLKAKATASRKKKEGD